MLVFAWGNAIPIDPGIQTIFCQRLDDPTGKFNIISDLATRDDVTSLLVRSGKGRRQRYVVLSAEARKKNIRLVEDLSYLYMESKWDDLNLRPAL